MFTKATMAIQNDGNKNTASVLSYVVAPASNGQSTSPSLKGDSNEE